MKLHNLCFFYLVPQYATKRQKSNIFEFHSTLDVCSFIDTLYNKYLRVESVFKMLAKLLVIIVLVSGKLQV
jgi:hypothetical protein